MAKFLTSKKGLALFATLIAVATAIGAYAYFTSTGSGSGSASVGTAADNLTVTGTASDDLYPGGPGVEVDFTAGNPSNFNQKLSSISLTSVDAPTGCDASVFHMADVTVGEDGNLDPESSDAALTEYGTLYMDDNGDNQDDCKNADLTLHFTTS